MGEILLPLLILCPLVASMIISVSAGRVGTCAIGAIACVGVGLSAILGIILSVMLLSGPAAGVLPVVLWRWIHVAGFSADIALTLDRVSMVMVLVVTVVGLLIHVYAVGYMREDPGIARFFSCMTLFVAAMLVLVLASDLLCLFIGWEGVGLCSYLLIGFWYDDPANTAAARKAFYMTRMGDAALLCGLLLLATAAGSLHIGAVLAAVADGQVAPSGVNVAALFILVGALAKSAQVPFQTWLPDAMAGPTPTSALIHAATMVTAGVYLIARLHDLFAMAAPVMALTAVLGTLTLLMAACTAMVQSDLKRILAWSTISQLGYMFLALGCGVWQAALFHLMTHAFFKALLFLTAGAVIMRAGHEQDIFRLGGLRHAMPGLTAAFVVGASALAGLPLVTAGFYSKEMILSGVWHVHFGLTREWTLSGHPLWGMALLGAFLTALYIFRCVFIVFCGKPGTVATGRTSRLMGIPLGCLCFLSLCGGVIEMPDTLPPLHLFTALLDPKTPLSHADEPVWLVLAGALAPLAGLGVARVLWGRAAPVMREIPGQAAITRLARAGWGMDALYDLVFVQPFRLLTWLAHHDILDQAITGTGRMTRAISGRVFRARAGFLDKLAVWGTRARGWAGHLLGRLDNGRVRWYAAWIAGGLCAGLAMAVLS
ncbi:NADH-quinone oxidoreductase subunit L [Komagataeibacter swingsii]|uniref:NADH-quinone oxidoreductase subunit L n=1 Tax=Komagataeibacter swingsii TaxID=215220 RepID=A0A2V4RTF8_9PROT|nr:NADH-quinone oxidoreductase subunit L [Komagataeibacter swingsii]PYD70937.1 NADH-quinone oxidoreductase subunit L [Komagataeibacter swingsii]GBQ56129.1 NADH-quinone oxidoreductase chain L [Komagataeibacter swingsii DSM 16373]